MIYEDDHRGVVKQADKLAGSILRKEVRPEAASPWSMGKSPDAIVDKSLDMSSQKSGTNRRSRRSTEDKIRMQ